MIKNILFLIFSLVLLHDVKAESPDSLIGYFTNSGRKVSKDSAFDFYRIVLPPDTTVNKDHYRIYDYYPNGKVQSISTSLTQPYVLLLDGMHIEYFPSGKRKRVSQFNQGSPIGTVVNYYPNGKLYSVLKVDKWDLILTNKTTYSYQYATGIDIDTYFGYEMTVEEMYDSTGTALVEKGTGHAIFFDEQFKTVMQEGNVRKGKKEGEWKGLIADSGSYVCIFHNDNLKTGTTTLNSGRHYNFSKPAETAVFSDGEKEFYYYLRKNIKYPKSAKQYDINGTVKVGFYVEKDGTLSNIHIVKSLIKSLDDEALRVVRNSPYWYPAHKFGIPLRTDWVIDVDFHNW